ncbi:MAG: LysR family transcriptional regulator [Burkholderiales bacterium]|nr:LysR family transcriptional regulator [Burkholderiales bacterium]
MKLDIDGIQAFVLIAELGGFQRAAERLRLTQTALTRRIQRLEAYLGLKLLDRTTRSVSLTTVGEEFLPQARRLVEELTHSVDRLKGMSHGASGNVALACIASVASQRLPAVIRAYAARHPGNRVRILDRTGTQVAAAVRQGQAEFGVTILPTREPDLVEEPLYEDPFVLFCAAGHRLAASSRIAWKELREGELIVFGGASGNRLLVDYQLAGRRLALRGRYEVEQTATALGLVLAGIGAAVLPASAMGPGAGGSVRRVPLVNPVIRRAVGIVRRRGASLSPAARALQDLLAIELRSPAGGSEGGR